MTPIGHTAVSYLAGKATRLPVLGVIAGGLWPDLDFLLLPLASFNELHRTITHNLLFVVLGGLAVSVLVKRDRRRFFLAFLLGGLLHLLVDACMDDNPTNGIGIAMLWPFSSEMICPINFLTPNTNTAGWSDPSYAWQALRVFFLAELPFTLAAIGLAVWTWAKRSIRPDPRAREAGR